MAEPTKADLEKVAKLLPCAGFKCFDPSGEYGWEGEHQPGCPANYRPAVAQALADEREACAVICDFASRHLRGSQTADSWALRAAIEAETLAAAIRARGA